MRVQYALLSAIVGLAASPLISAASHTRQVACTSAAIPLPTLLGAEILDISVAEFHTQTALLSFGGFHNNLAVSYCGVNVSSTHPRWNDTINIEVWLPLDDWNGRFQGTGGGGFQTGDGASALVLAVSDGYAAASTDGCHPYENPDVAAPANWALLSPGNLNLPLLQDLAAVALSDMTLIGQAITESFYGEKPSYPELYDGIVALAPAINRDTFLVTVNWPQQVMNQLRVYPPPCELKASTNAAVAACDDLDGLEDGIISDANACTFDPYSVVGETIECDDGKERQVTTEGAKVADAVWSGLIDPSGTRQWIKYFIAKDGDFALGNMTNEEYFRVLHQSRNQYSSIIGTSDPNLSLFKARNGKLITWHGLADQLIFPNGTEEYYKRVAEQVEGVQDFYRYFEAPGVGYCREGAGTQPVGELEALVKWVEQGVAPDELSAVNETLNGKAPDAGQSLPTRKLCVWPKKHKYNGEDPLVAESFDCF